MSKKSYKHATLFSLLIAGLFMQLSVVTAHAGPTYAPEKIAAVMVGDRVVDIALGLGVIPQAMVIRGSQWEKGAQLKLATDILGCPLYATKKKPKAVAAYMKKYGLKKIIVEKSPQFCLHKKKVNPVNIVGLVADVPGVQVEYVDFSQGVASAIKQIALILDKEQLGIDLVQKYEKGMESIKVANLGKRVLVLKGLNMASGKYFVQVEAPGGYSDHYILSKLGCENIGAKIFSKKMKVSKGFATKRKFTDLDQANPDVIVITGDADAVQRAIAKALKDKPSLAEVPAIKNGAVICLPMYVDSSVLEYPKIFRQWKNALSM
ncbi:ABC transporter substrate-binding protein [Desulfovibrio sp. JC010]|uniref:ABC transporter substrate-binding protein n=1 Tax=Desulfovibrio sp. JC010 TaxID=2593641 RepID=UPI0013D77635|nr:ABC transporter substrate-binding protein [Desulfovibrio sp. JC010]NDV28569.1 ABC transporter substrate-binding protein [Desulfovibrio sp. JC010]